MKILIKGTMDELSEFQNKFNDMSGITIVEISRPYIKASPNIYERYIECQLNTTYSPAQIIEKKLLEDNDA